MNKKLSLIALIAILLSSCGNDDPAGPAYMVQTLNVNNLELSFNSNGVWTDVLTPNANIKNDYFQLSHGVVVEWGSWSGFVASQSTDKNDYSSTGFYPDHQYSAITGKGKLGSSYIIGYWNTSDGAEEEGLEAASCSITSPAGNFYPESICVTNTTYTYFSMKNGDAYAKKFTDDDQLILNIYGQTPEGEIVGPVKAYLANGTKLVSDWVEVKLNTLGLVKGLFFTMESTDSGQWGMNTPAYFAIDQINIEFKIEN